MHIHLGPSRVASHTPLVAALVVVHSFQLTSFRGQSAHVRASYAIGSARPDRSTFLLKEL